MVLDPIQGRVHRDFIVPGFTRYGPRSLGFPIRSLEIDNPTGQWLLVKDSVMRVPPYTINYRVNIQPSMETLEIVPLAVGGFSSTSTGDQIRFVARDYEVLPSDGIALTPSHPTTAAAVDFDQADIGGNSGSHIVVPATQRCRLYVSTFSYNNADLIAGATLFPCQCVLSLPGEVFYLNINAEQPSFSIEFGPGLDLAAGQDINYLMISGDAVGNQCNLSSVYTLI
jgi:hypothetical protein